MLSRRIRDFFTSETAIIAACSAVLFPILTLCAGAVLITGLSALKKTDLQNCADLSVLSANATYTNALYNFEEEPVARRKAANTVGKLYKLCVGEATENNNNVNFSVKPDGSFEITTSEKVDSMFSDQLNDVNIKVMARVKDNFERGERVSAQDVDASSEVVFAYDASFSMNLPVRSSRQNGATEPASESLKRSGNNAIDILFDNMTEQELQQFAYSQIVYSQNIKYRSRQRNQVDNKEFQQRIFNRQYNVRRQNDATNILLAVNSATEVIDDLDPKIKKTPHNEFIVLMSDGVPTATFYTDATRQGRRCTTGFETEIINPSTCRIDGTGGERCRRRVICRGRIITETISNNTGQPQIFYWENLDDFDEYTEFLAAEKIRIKAECDRFKNLNKDSRRIFSVFFLTDNEYINDGKEIMQSCASPDEDGKSYFYFAQNSAELQAAYADIAARIREESTSEVFQNYDSLRITQ